MLAMVPGGGGGAVVSEIRVSCCQASSAYLLGLKRLGEGKK